MKRVVEEIVPFQEALLDGLKELARIGLLAILPIIIVQLESGKIDLKVLWVLFAVAVLKAFDKFLHTKAKSEGPNERNKGLLGIKGLTGF